MQYRKKSYVHYSTLIGVIILGAALRFWHLDLKPLWLDEVLTALFSLGRSYGELPLEVVFPVSKLEEIFTLKSGISCSTIAQTIAAQSTHPPLFFCLMHSWQSWLGTEQLIWVMRSLSVLMGVGAIVAIYCLSRRAFSPSAALMAAALMAFSPFAVYLSQEARHYTMPMLLITLALWGLIQIEQDLYTRRGGSKPIIWLCWAIVNSIGCYVHYFFIIAFLAQLMTLTGLMYWRRHLLPTGSWVTLSLTVIGVTVSYLPWLPVLLNDFGRAETGWLPKPENIAPLYQTLLGWLAMVIALPIEAQPLAIAVPMTLLTVAFGSWFGWCCWRGYRHLWQQSSTQLATLTLSGFTLSVLLQFAVIVYLLGKDITIAPRYNFVYYPAVCILLGASLTLGYKQQSQVKAKETISPSPSLPLSPALLLPLSISLLSSLLVASNLVFLKPFHPQQVAQDMNLEQNIPLVVVMGYKNIQDVALGLSFALAIDQLKSGLDDSATRELSNTQSTAGSYFAFLPREQGYELIWQQLSRLSALPAPPLNLWVVAPGLKRRNYPQQLGISTQTNCTLDPTQHYRIGIPYQLYRCL
ncbi:MAG: hypothetical protein F6K58_29305 [Symploca sp. SIO2E9]|nr:hypothetical protein [Symploca sp. SIO2E9]